MKIEIKRMEEVSIHGIKYECIICGSHEKLCGVFDGSGIVDIADVRCSEYYCPLVICEKCLKKMLESFKRLKRNENDRK